jgi:copper(I)-binding protein
MKAKTLALAAAALFVATAAQAHSHKFKKLEIVHPWCIETDAAASTVSVYMTVRNSGPKADRLVGAQTSIAAKAELFGATVTSAQQAKPITSLEAKASGELILKRDGPHIVLTGVKKQLGAYDAFPMTLVFERAGKVEIEVQVEEASILEPARH